MPHLNTPYSIGSHYDKTVAIVDCNGFHAFDAFKVDADEILKRINQKDPCIINAEMTKQLDDITGRTLRAQKLQDSLIALNIISDNTAALDVIAERIRQIRSERFDTKHDDEHNPGELSGAGAAYALYAANTLHPYSQGDGFDGEPPPGWCWDKAWWKPTTSRKNLVKAAALILAEIEKIDRN